MQAVNNYIIVQKIKQGPKTVGGLILTEDIDDDNRYIKATVVSTGNLVEGIKETKNRDVQAPHLALVVISKLHHSKINVC